MFKKIILGFALGCVSLASALTLEDLQKKLNHPVITANFEQIRSLKGMKKPIISSGSFIVSAKDGLYWAQSMPFKLTMVMTKDKLAQQVENGKPEILTAKRNPQIFQFNQLLSSLFTMNVAEINTYFDLSINETKGIWNVKLHPKKEPINKIFKVIVLHGQNFINKVELHDQQGDTTTIQFKNHQTMDILSVSDQKKFKF